MEWLSLYNNTSGRPIFTTADIVKWYPDEPESHIFVQLSRFIRNGQLIQIKKGLYLVGNYKVADPFIFAEKLRSPSYISLETALNYYGIIPDIPAAVTSITTQKTKNYETPYGKFIYRSIKPELYFGYKNIAVGNSKIGSYNIASPEKALLDYLYLNNQIKDTCELRLKELDQLDNNLLSKYSEKFNNRVKTLLQNIKNE